MAEPARTEAKDDIAIQHRPDNAQSAHSSLRPTGADHHARGRRDAAGPEPDPAEAEIAAHGRVDHGRSSGFGDTLRQRLVSRRSRPAPLPRSRPRSSASRRSPTGSTPSS